MKRKHFLLGGLSLSITTCFVCLTQAANPPPKVIVQETAISAEVKARTSFAPVVKQVVPSVVNIFSTMTVRESMGRNPLLDDPLLRRFFGEDFGGQDEPRERKSQSLGSGVIVSPEGYILTANHVVEGADKVRVAMSSGDKEFEARVIGTDPPTDLAVLKIEMKTNLPAITISDSAKLEVGDTVLAVGNPFGVGQTVTMGIVSALSRGGFGLTGYEDFIQTDAAINPGNSGGALVDAQGRLVGINTAILSRSGGFQGVGFAVPINLARFVMDRIVTEGKVTRGYLGIQIQPLTSELSSQFRFPDGSSGALVGGISPGSAAEKAGVREGDVVVEFNGKKVVDPRSLQFLVAQSPPGSNIRLKVLRAENQGKPVERVLTAKLDELPRDMFASDDRRGPGEGVPSASDALDGAQITDLDSQARKQFNIPQRVHGALVARVTPDSNAAEAGLRPGDVIMEINRQTVGDARDAAALTSKTKEDRLLLRVWSSSGLRGQGGTRYLVFDNSKRK